MADVHGVWRDEGEAGEIVLDRLYPQPIDTLWAALTIPARLADWLGADWLGGEAQLEAGDRYDYRFKNTEMESRGRVLRTERPHLIEHSWFENIPPPAIVRWELAEEAGGTRLTLTHRFGMPDDGPRTGAGWTQIMETLAAFLDDRPPAGGMASWRAARDAYRASFPAQALRDGMMTRVEGVEAVRFERQLKAPQVEVWPVLVTPELVARWFQADVVIESRVGGDFRLRFHGMDAGMDGEVTRWDPPRQLEFRWTEAAANGSSRVRITLAPDGTGTRLGLEHILDSGGDAPGLATGWHWHLDCLERALLGETMPRDRPRIEALQRAYAATLSTSPILSRSCRA